MRDLSVTWLLHNANKTDWYLQSSRNPTELILRSGIYCSFVEGPVDVNNLIHNYNIFITLHRVKKEPLLDIDDFRERVN